VHGGAVTSLASDGRTWPWVPGACDELLLDELLLLELLLLPPEAISHGGTTSRSILLFSAMTSWFCAVGGVCGVLPPGDMRIVLTACWL
jgi:hypothetical protein